MSSALKTVSRWARTAVFEPVSPAPLALFRIGFSLIVFVEFLHLVHRRDFVFLAFPLRQSLPTSTVVALAAWGVVILMLAFGLLTPVAAFLNYRFVATYFRPDALFSYHADMLYVPAALLLVVLPSYRCLSLDSFLLKKFFGIDWSRRPIPRLYQNVTILWVMEFMYFDSALYKLNSPFWLDGLGFWLPVSFPSFTTFSWNLLLNQQFIVRFAGYLTLLFESIFIFLFWVPPARFYLFIIGLVLHLGIAIAFPIPLFGLLMVVLYICFFPDPSLDRLIAPLRVARETSQVRPLESESLPFDLRMGRVFLGVAALVTLVQATITFDVPIVSEQAAVWVHNNLGLTHHRVFGQWQFTVMKADIALAFYDKEGTEHWIPWVTKNGHIGSEAYGRFWSFWWLNSLPGRRGQRELWARASEAWAKRQGYRLEGGQVLVKYKPVVANQIWEKDRHQNMENLSWMDLMAITWTDGQRDFKVLQSSSRIDAVQNRKVTTREASDRVMKSH